MRRSSVVGRARQRLLRWRFEQSASPDTREKPEDSRLWDENAFLEGFDSAWRAAREGVPRWRDSGLPRHIRSYAEFCQLPLTSRSDIQNDPRSFIQQDLRGAVFTATGGSTGRPLKFPLFREELELGRLNQIRSRREYGIEPGDICFMIWGHAANLEGNWKARAEECVRAFKDAVMGYYRVSAYHLTREVLRAEFDQAVRRSAGWIYAYSSSLLSLVRANLDRRIAARSLGLKACIAAAEPLTVEEKAEISDFFNCPVGMEYGSVEMRVCAHTRPNWQGYHVFTQNYLLEALPADVPGVFNLAVTKLFRAAMPLVRYLVGDQICKRDHGFTGGPLLQFDDVAGRQNDNLIFRDGAEIHSEVVTHAIRSEQDVLAFQLHQYKDRIELHLVMRSESAAAQVQQRIRERLSRVHHEFSTIRFRGVEDVDTTPAGKRRWVIRHAE